MEFERVTFELKSCFVLSFSHKKRDLDYCKISVIIEQDQEALSFPSSCLTLLTHLSKSYIHITSLMFTRISFTDLTGRYRIHSKLCKGTPANVYGFKEIFFVIGFWR